MELSHPDLLHLQAAVGWLELGNAGESLAELEQASAKSHSHPDVLETRWLVLARLHRWDEAVPVGHALCVAAPNRAVGRLHHAYALRRAKGGGLQAAFNALSQAAPKFPDEPTVPYNLACYSCQMQREATETLAWLRQAIKIGGRKKIIAMAMQDPDLEPLRTEIEKLARPQ